MGSVSIEKGIGTGVGESKRMLFTPAPATPASVFASEGMIVQFGYISAILTLMQRKSTL